MRSLTLLALSALLLSCSMLTLSDTSDQLYAGRFQPADESVSMRSSDLRELSGLVHSVANPGLFWAHNDSGNQARVFLINPKSGDVVMQVTLAGLRNYDFEDITLRQEAGQSFVVVGDIGDNAGARKGLALYQFPEPVFEGKSNIILPKDRVETMHLSYAEGARDAETLMTAPNGNLIIVTKREAENFVYEFAFNAGQHLTLEALGKVAINNITAGDINQAGEIVLRNYAQIFYWPASTDSPTQRLIQTSPIGIPTAPEPQGEAIAWRDDGGLFSIPEKPFMFDQVVFRYDPVTAKHSDAESSDHK